MSNRKDHLQKQAKKQARIQAELDGQKIQTQEGENPIPPDAPHGNIRVQSDDIEYVERERVPEPTQEEPDPPKRSRNKSGRRWWEETPWDRKR